jgi:hypothetical protein
MDGVNATLLPEEAAEAQLDEAAGRAFLGLPLG